MNARLLAIAALVLMAPPLFAQGDNGQRLAWRDELLDADRAASDTALTSGLAAALARAGHQDLVLVYPGAPVVAGRELVARVLAGQDALRGLRLRWVPLFAEVSSDGKFGVSYGVTSIAAAPGSAGGPLRMGKYLSAWQRGPDGWRLAAHAQLGLLPASSYSPVPEARQASRPLPKTGAAAEFARADSAFAALAGREGASAAFAAWAAADAVMFPGTGELVRGPEEIRRLMVERTPSSWRWAPVRAGASTAGDLGFTVGEAVITPPGGAPAYTKYLTLWRREPDGRIRFLSDGGNARPAP